MRQRKAQENENEKCHFQAENIENYYGNVLLNVLNEPNWRNRLLSSLIKDLITGFLLNTETHQTIRVDQPKINANEFGRHNLPSYWVSH